MNFAESVSGVPNAEAVISEDSILINRNGEFLFRINCISASSDYLEKNNYSFNKFSVSLLRNKHLSFNRRVISITGQDRIGYIFNINALTDSSDEYDINAWDKIFLHASLEGITKLESVAGIFNHHKNLDEANLEDLIEDESIYVLCLSHDALEKLEIDENQTKVNLSAFGFIDVSSKFNELTEHSNYLVNESSINFRKMSDHLCDKMELIKMIFDLSESQKDSFSKFLTLYQLIEVLISDIFQSVLEKSIEKYKTNPRDLSEDIAKISKEKTRINVLFTDYLDPKKTEYSYFDECANMCNIFLDQISQQPEGTRNQKWPQAIYEIRNKIVHGKSHLLDRNDQFLEIAHYFKLCCLEILVSFNLNKSK